MGTDDQATTDPAPLSQSQKRRDRISSECNNAFASGLKKSSHRARWTVSQPQPYHFRRMSQEHRSLLEVDVLGHDHQSLCRREGPNYWISCF